MKIKYLYFALSALFVCSCAGDIKEKLNVSADNPGECVFSKSFVQNFIDVKTLSLHKEKDNSISVYMYGDNFTADTNAEKYQNSCEKNGDMDLNMYMYMYMSSPSDAVVNDFRSIHVYSNEKCIDDELIVKFSSCKEFIKSHYTIPEGLVHGGVSVLDVNSAYVFYEKPLNCITENDLLLSNSHYSIVFKSEPTNKKMEIKVEMTSSDGRTVSETKWLNF